MTHFSKLVAFVVLVALLFSGSVAVKANGQETCPNSSPWVKVDGLSGTSFTYTAPAGYTITEWCYKASTTVVYGSASGTSVTVTSTVTNKNGQVQDLSHASFKLGTVPTEEPTVNPTEDPTETPTEVPTEEPTVEPTPPATQPPEETETPTQPPVVPTTTTQPKYDPEVMACVYVSEGLNAYIGQTFAIRHSQGWFHAPDKTWTVGEENGKGKVVILWEPQRVNPGIYDVLIGGNVIFKAVVSYDGRKLNCGWSAPAQQPVPATGSEELPDEGSGYEVYILVIAALALSSLFGVALLKRR